MPSRSPPIGLKSIEIVNFRQIDSLHLDFAVDGNPSDIVVLAGPNGCGKTTVLEACLLALGYTGEFQGAKGRDAIRFGAKDWELTAEVQTRNATYLTTTHSDGRATWVNTSNEYDAGRVIVSCLYVTSWRAPKLVGSLPITAGKRGKRPADTEQNRIWRTKQHLIDSRAHKLMAQGTLFEGTEAYDRDLYRLNAVWGEFHPRAEEEFVVEPVGTDPSDGFDVFLRHKHGRKVSVDALSSGQLELFALFGALMLSKFTDGVVVIDEPELHLDPQWHALMLRAIRQFLPVAQLIVATHSPKVYDSVMSFQRHFLVPENDPRSAAWKSPAATAT